MTRGTAFIFIVLFAILFLISCMPGIHGESYGKIMDVAAQIGLGISLLVFFILPPKKKESPKTNSRSDAN